MVVRNTLNVLLLYPELGGIARGPSPAVKSCRPYEQYYPCIASADKSRSYQAIKTGSVTQKTSGTLMQSITAHDATTIEPPCCPIKDDKFRRITQTNVGHAGCSVYHLGGVLYLSMGTRSCKYLTIFTTLHKHPVSVTEKWHWVLRVNDPRSQTPAVSLATSPCS